MSFGWHVVLEFQPTHRSYTRTAVGPLLVQDRNVPCDRVVQVLFDYSTRLRIPRAYIDEHPLTSRRHWTSWKATQTSISLQQIHQPRYSTQLAKRHPSHLDKPLATSSSHLVLGQGVSIPLRGLFLATTIVKDTETCLICSEISERLQRRIPECAKARARDLGCVLSCVGARSARRCEMIYPNPTLSREHRKGHGSSVEVLHRSPLWQNNGSYKPPSPDETRYFESNEDWVAGKRERRQNSCQPVAAPLRRILKPIAEEIIAVT
ncbi:hypothetical protein F5J12DRAFT_355731 [Pisolithus orientalis]|uniref:uncharacterized protein n=1 Tax=Pisolithus orientalis TaxID=936130 RepID=UPI00222580BE|nr:uncharacterized protein F5J12DRAFT_355731 [Pisolithus orientalis]KAI5996477.1 hypothetical protein F5J12DRAFT_355731 [Pisolithus orientalis]